MQLFLNFDNYEVYLIGRAPFITGAPCIVPEAFGNLKPGHKVCRIAVPKKSKYFHF